MRKSGKRKEVERPKSEVGRMKNLHNGEHRATEKKVIVQS
jgi:hypothetical protein